MKQSLLLCVCLLVLLSGCAAPKEEAAEPSFQESAGEAPVDGEATGESTPREESPAIYLELDTPENHGVDAAMLEALHAAVEEAEEPQIWSMVTVRHGAVVDEYYGIDKRNEKQFDQTTPFYLASCTKSFSGALIGIAIDKGFISGVDVKLSAYFPGLADETNGKEEITLEHLLTHTSGLEWYEWDGGAMFHQLHQQENWVDFVLSRPMAAEPGATFNYNSGTSHLLTAVLEQATGQSALDFARENLFGPLGMDSVNWPADPQGIPDGGSGIEMTARDAAKLGQLYLNGGKWGEEQIISQAWVEQSTTPQSAGPGGRTGQYGYQWWIRSFGDGDYQTFFAMGGGGHHIFVVPQLELVVVMTCYNSGDTYAVWPYFTDYILPACTE